MTGMLKFQTVLLVLGLRCLACLSSEHGEDDATNTALSGVIAAAADGDPASVELLCDGNVCKDDGFVYVGTHLHMGVIHSNRSRIKCLLELNDVNVIKYMFRCTYSWRMADLGYKYATGWVYSADTGTFYFNLHVFVIAEYYYNDNDILCNGPPCLDNGIMKVGDKISVYLNKKDLKEFVHVEINLPGISESNYMTWFYVLEMKDLGLMQITLRVWNDNRNTTLTRDIIVLSDPPFGMDMMCNGKFCQDNETMRFGDEISCYLEPKGMVDRLTFSLLIDDHAIVEGYPRTHVLREEDVGTKSIECRASSTDYAPFQIIRNINVVCAFRDDVVYKPVKRHPPFSMDMMCNGKFCQDNETMRFGDEISCYFEPMSMLDRLTFSLLIDGHAIVEGYPCMHVLREEDVGTKLIECHANGTKCGPYQRTRNISVVCDFRDDVIWEPMRRPFDIEAYTVKFHRGNVTYPSGVIILCGDEPCDKPGRIIYTGTYVTCRLRDGQLSNLNFLVNDQRINAKRETPFSLSEISYKFQDKDTNHSSSSAKCVTTATAVDFINETIVTFRVRKWPCLEIKQASDDIMLEHGEAAGAIDGGLTEKIDEEPAAGNKDGPKWNDDEEPAAGNKDGPKQNDGIPAEKSAKDDESKPNSGNGQGSSVLLQLFLDFIAAYVGLGQF